MSFINDHYHRPSWPGGIPGTTLRLTLAVAQLIIGLAVCGLYGQDLAAARRAHVYADAKWVYAVAVGGASAVLAALYVAAVAPKYLHRWALAGPELVACLAWVVLFGIFGKMYIGEDPENVGHGDGPAMVRLKNAVWVDLAGAVAWGVTAAWAVGAALRGGDGGGRGAKVLKPGPVEEHGS
jgi:hypothetical protein